MTRPTRAARFALPRRLAALAFALVLGSTAQAQTATGDTKIDWLALAMGVIGGLALFLYGVDLLATHLKQAQGGRFKALLERSATNRFTALASGTVATIALDSSSVVIILLIASIDAGLVTFAQALPAILGANIGTTVSSQVFAWNVDAYAPVLLVAGLAWKALARSDEGRMRATILLGLGLVLFGLSIIGTATEPLQDHPDVIARLRSLDDPLLGALAGAVVTIAIQSSSAMMGIVITLAGGGLISMEAGVAMMIGAEVGTCADTLIATVGRSRDAIRAGVFHLLFNIASAALGLLLIDQLIAVGTATALDTGQRIANAHVLFNVVGALLALFVVQGSARLLTAMIPDRGEPREGIAAPE